MAISSMAHLTWYQAAISAGGDNRQKSVIAKINGVIEASSAASENK